MLQDQIQESISHAITSAVRSQHWAKYVGEICESLGEQICQAFNIEFVELCSSGTAALEIVLRAMKIGQHDEVLLSGYDYPGNFWAIERTGARVALVDVAEGNWAINLDSLEQAYSSNCRALVVSHLHGQLQDIPRLRTWCSERGLMLIEDACQAIGAKIDGNAAGTLGDAGIFSFGGGKVLSSGRGGAVVTGNPELAQRARIAAGAGSGPYGLSQIQAALVSAQLPYLEQLNHHTRQYFAELNAYLANIPMPFSFPASNNLESAGFYQAGWMLLARTIENNAPQPHQTIDSVSLDELVNRLRALGINAGTGFAGFFRRSSRRCRISTALGNSMAAATRTFVIHHKLAFDHAWPAERLAEAIGKHVTGV